MSTNKNLFKEAIADAKAVREAALANAKAALEEALTPKLEYMLAAKLQEMDQDELEEIDYIQRSNGVSESDMYEEEGLEEDFDLSEILAELDAENQEMEEDLYEAMDDEEEDKSEGSIGDMSVEELKDLIADIVHSELEQEEEETPEDEEAEQDDEEGIEMPDEDDEEVDLNELLAELDALDEDEETPTPEEAAKKLDQIAATLEESAAMSVWEAFSNLSSVGGYSLSQEAANVIEQFVIKLFGLFGASGAAFAAGTNKQIQDAIKKGYTGLMDFIKSKSKLAYSAFNIFLKKHKKDIDAASSSKNINAASSSEMNEAIRIIKTLRNELNETNLLNAKLLYVNKIFKSKNLTESQKLKVIASFDKATTPKQAKQLFESIQSNFSTTKKSIVRESLGFASKPIGGAPRKQIIDTNDQFARWQKLANIK
jgi:hypothetical protein